MNFVMKVKIIATIIVDIPVYTDDVCNSDTIADYVTQLKCDIDNAALEYLSEKIKNSDYLEVNMVEPEWIDGQPVFEGLVNNWQPEYERRMNEVTKA